MNEGISADEACSTGALFPEDFERMCNEDGTLKQPAKSTTFTIKNDSSKSLTIDNTHLQVFAALALVTIFIIVVFTFRHLRKKKRSK